MTCKALKAHYSIGQRRAKDDIFEIQDSDLAISLIAQKCVEVIEMKKGKGTKGGKKC